MAYWKITYGGVPYYVNDQTGNIYDATGNAIVGYRAAPDATGTWHIYGPSGLDWALKSDWYFYDPMGTVMASVEPKPYQSMPWEQSAVQQPKPQIQQQTYGQSAFNGPFFEEGMKILQDSLRRIKAVQDARQGLFDMLKGVL